MGEVVYDDIPLSQCRHWFTDCWFKRKDNKLPVYVRSVYDQHLLVDNALNSPELVKLSELDVALPRLGYVEFKPKGGRGGMNVLYLSYLGTRSYKKGFNAERVNYTHTKPHTSYKEDGKCIISMSIQKGMLSDYLRLVSSPELAYGAFYPVRRTFKDCSHLLNHIYSTGDSLVLSENFSLTNSPYSYLDRGWYYMLCYRGYFIAHISQLQGDDTVTISIDDRLRFLKQQIEKEISDVKFIGL